MRTLLSRLAGKKRRILYHDHMIAMLRADIGERRANLLLHDFIKGGTTQAEALGKACHGDLSGRSHGLDWVYYAVVEDREPSWIGADLQLHEHLPQTIQDAVIGKRLGDVVSGTGADNHIIVAVGHRQQGTRIVIETELIEADSIEVPLHKRFTGPMRRGIQTAIASWRENFIENAYLEDPTITSMVLTTAIMLFMGAGFVVLMGIAEGFYGHKGLLLMAAVAPLAIWILSGITMTLKINFKTYGKKWRDD